VINQYLVEDLRKLGLWTPGMKNAIIGAGGSVQGIASIPAELKELYKTVWEIKVVRLA
jgi:ribonucleoside-diphosphate reductase alpha chain